MANLTSKLAVYAQIFNSPKKVIVYLQKPSGNPSKTPRKLTINSRYTGPMPFDLVVAGAGIVGAACALEFVRSGLTVAIVEPSEIGGGATAAGMGHLAVMDDSPAQFALPKISLIVLQPLARSAHLFAHIVEGAARLVQEDDHAGPERRSSPLAGGTLDRALRAGTDAADLRP